MRRRSSIAPPAALVFLIALTVPLLGQEKVQTRIPPINEPVDGAVPLVDTDDRAVTFRLKLPEDVFALTVSIENAPADLDLAMYTTSGELVTYSERPDYNESLTLRRNGDPGLEGGYFDFEVVYQLPERPVVDGEELTEIPFQITFSVVQPTVRRELSTSASVGAVLQPEEAMAHVYRIRVPTGTPALRLDVSDTTGDLDLLLSRDRIPLDAGSADHRSQSFRSSESLTIDRDSTPRLRPGVYYVLVLDQVSDTFASPYTLTVSDTQDPPEALQTPIIYPIAEDGLHRAVVATVEVLTDYGGGSGVLVSPEGHILTNRHVVVNHADAPAEDITIGFSHDLGAPAEELFQARVIDDAVDRDLALLQIVSGRYGQELPTPRAFPAVPIRRDSSVSMGDTLHFVGYPWIGSTGSRSTVTYTRGVVAGFQTVPFGRIIKTDAVINEGSSGGAALDAELRLVGLTTEVVGFDTSQLGYIYPVHSIPRNWLRIIGADESGGGR
ncbi:MAG: trypsin-like peptidase domain-containing protein [Alkalispirochaeta sp.]